MRSIWWTSLAALPIRALHEASQTPPAAFLRAAPFNAESAAGATSTDDETTMPASQNRAPIYIEAAIQERAADAPAPEPGKPRVLHVVASTETLDSHDSILVQNWDLKRFSENPVVLWAHSRTEVPIGTAKARLVGAKGAKDRHLEADITFPPEGKFARSDEVWKAWDAGLLRGVSVGFRAHTVRWEKHEDREVLVFDDLELLELSFVPVGSNPETLAEARALAIAELRASAPPATTPAAPTAAETPAAAVAANKEIRMDPKMIARDLGLPEDTNESQIRSHASALATGLSGILTALGVTTVDAARGAIEAGRAAIAELPKAQTRVKELETAAENAERAGIIAKLESEKRLTPAQRDGFAKTASLEALRSFAETAPVIVAGSQHHEAPAAPSVSGSGALPAPATVDGKRAYEHLTGPERVALQKDDPTTFNAVRESWIARGRPPTPAAG